MRFSKSEMSKCAKNLRKKIKENKGHPSKVTMVDMDNKKHELSKSQYPP